MVFPFQLLFSKQNYIKVQLLAVDSLQLQPPTPRALELKFMWIRTRLGVEEPFCGEVLVFASSLLVLCLLNFLTLFRDLKTLVLNALCHALFGTFNVWDFTK